MPGVRHALACRIDALLPVRIEGPSGRPRIAARDACWVPVRRVRNGLASGIDPVFPVYGGRSRWRGWNHPVLDVRD
jgi:hypothetical protein